MEKQLLRQCHGCLTWFEQQPELAHYQGTGVGRYGVASAECCAAFFAIQAKESECYGYPPAHRLIVDAYAVQHPPRADWQIKLNIEPRLIRASVQSVAVHLIALYLALEKQLPLLKIAGEMAYLLDNMNPTGAEFTELQPPTDFGAINVKKVQEQVTAQILSLEEYHQVALDWAQSAYAAWQVHHPTIRQWYSQYGGKKV